MKIIVTVPFQFAQKAYKRQQGAQFSAAMSHCVESLFEQDIRLHFMQIKCQLQ